MSRVQGVRRAQRRPRTVPVAGRRAVRLRRVRSARGHRQRGEDPVGRGHTGPRGVHWRDGQPGRGVRGEKTVDEKNEKRFVFSFSLLIWF